MSLGKVVRQGRGVIHVPVGEGHVAAGEGRAGTKADVEAKVQLRDLHRGLLARDREALDPEGGDVEEPQLRSPGRLSGNHRIRLMHTKGRQPVGGSETAIADGRERGVRGSRHLTDRPAGTPSWINGSWWDSNPRFWAASDFRGPTSGGPGPPLPVRTPRGGGIPWHNAPSAVRITTVCVGFGSKARLVYNTGDSGTMSRWLGHPDGSPRRPDIPRKPPGWSSPKHTGALAGDTGR